MSPGIGLGIFIWIMVGLALGLGYIDDMEQIYNDNNDN